ncbi:MAG: hypothetical protein FD146_1962 [Anaerolineaceae bacterium]|nr:MAG: hypothetical protein FD146_1962 [Anaerolineaceae bacterium]
MPSINRLRDTFARHKYKAATFLLLAAASLVCVTLVAARIAYSDTQQYRGLVWNLFLAWIPFALAYLAYMLSWRRWLVFVAVPLFAFLWLVFFPNAPYILTDLQHLGQTDSNVPLWYDVILLVWFSWTGMLLGVVSLNLMQEIIKRHFGRWLGWIFVFVVAGLSSAGVYVGRFIRLNSWDIFQNPTGAAADLFSWLSDPSLRSVGFVGLYTLFFLFVYLTFYAFGHILQEGAGKGG